MSKDQTTEEPDAAKVVRPVLKSGGRGDPFVDFNRLTLRGWGVPAVALAGTRVRPEVLSALAEFPRLALCLNDDEAGRAGAAIIESAVGTRSIRCPPLPDAKDINELGQRPDGHDLFAVLATEVDRRLAKAA